MIHESCKLKQLRVENNPSHNKRFNKLLAISVFISDAQLFGCPGNRAGFYNRNVVINKKFPQIELPNGKWAFSNSWALQVFVFTIYRMARLLLFFARQFDRAGYKLSFIELR